MAYTVMPQSQMSREAAIASTKSVPLVNELYKRLGGQMIAKGRSVGERRSKKTNLTIGS